MTDSSLRRKACYVQTEWWRPKGDVSRPWAIGVVVCLFFATLLLSMLQLEGAPPLWWDEGWTLAVARNWVEQGHYGQLLNGQPAPPGLAAAFPVVAPVALSFRLFGVGIWQGRLPFALLTLATLALMYYLAYRLYNEPVALAAVFVVLFMSGAESLHPVVSGRQVLGEMTSLLFLLLGYACLLAGFSRGPVFALPCSISWGVALITKAQIPPFWLLSIVVPLLLTLVKRRWRAAILLGLCLLGSLGVYRAVPFVQSALLHGHTVPQETVVGLYGVVSSRAILYQRESPNPYQP